MVQQPLLSVWCSWWFMYCGQVLPDTFLSTHRAPHIMCWALVRSQQQFYLIYIHFTTPHDRNPLCVSYTAQISNCDRFTSPHDKYLACVIYTVQIRNSDLPPLMTKFCLSWFHNFLLHLLNITTEKYFSSICKMINLLFTDKHKTFTQCRLDAGMQSATLAQHYNNLG